MLLRILVGALYKGSTKVELHLFNNCLQDNLSDGEEGRMLHTIYVYLLDTHGNSFHTQFQCGRWLATRVPYPSTSWRVTTTPALTWPSPTSPAWASGESGSSTQTHNRVWPSAAWCVLRLASLMQWRWAVWMCQWQHCRTALSG